mmetsp:Transcript_9103/g.22915  ORF Transcript_9103/g.22915 Transcript_9103/m.22915 type:complete len:133 (+) Transcript_9103:1020-1418(+)
MLSRPRVILFALQCLVLARGAVLVPHADHTIRPHIQVFGGDKNRTRKISDLQHALSALEAAQQAGTAEYERVKLRNTQELARYKSDKSEDFHNMLVGFARVQAAFAERSFNVWMGVAEEFGIAASLADKLAA